MNNDSFSDSDNESSSFTNEEITIFTKTKEGYNIQTDDRYNVLLSKQIVVPQYHSTVSKLLATLPPVTKNPSFLPKSSARASRRYRPISYYFTWVPPTNIQ